MYLGPTADVDADCGSSSSTSSVFTLANSPSEPLVSAIPLVPVRNATGRSDVRVEQHLKRAFDIVFATAVLIAVLPVLALIAIAIRIDGPGPLLFVQRRIGLGGVAFSCIKLRTMHVDAAAMLEAHLAASAEARAEWDRDHKLRNDPRISRLGQFLRKYSLDELPQLLNIIAGQMSVVGPRPIIAAEIPKYGRFFASYASVKPGLTGLWQVSGRNDISYDARVQLDCDYARKQSLGFDFQILLRTVPVVLGAKGSY